MLRDFVIIFVMHLVAGYFMQTKKVSKLKREKKRYLFFHVALYTLFFIIFSPLVLHLTFLQGLAFSLFNGVLHFFIDYGTGQFKNKYLEKDKLKFNFTVGIDYILHLSILAISYFCLIKYIVIF